MWSGQALRDRVVISPPALLPSERKLMQRTFNPNSGKSKIWNKYYSSSMLGSFKALGMRAAEERKSINTHPKKVSNMKLVTMQSTRSSGVEPLKVPESHKSYKCGESDYVPKM